MNPAVAALLGVAILDERLTVGMGIGFVLVLVGSVLVARRPAHGTRVELPALDPVRDSP